MTAEAWVAVLAVACVGLLLVAVVAVREWWRMVDQYVEAVEESIEAMRDGVEAHQSTLEACDSWQAERTIADQYRARWLVTEAARREAVRALHLALSFYGRAVADADQLEPALVERDGLRADLDDARAALEDIA